MNIPNALTIFRILLIPVLVFILLSRFTGRELLGFAVFVLAAATDLIDGYLAKKKSQVTAFGQHLDPIADKLLVSSAFICFAGLKTVPVWMVIIIIGREIFVTGLRAAIYSKVSEFPSFNLGKIKTWFEAITICALILGEEILGNFYIIARVGLWLVIAFAVTSTIEYYFRFSSLLLSKDS